MTTPKMTNGDSIRKMTDEELVDFLVLFKIKNATLNHNKKLLELKEKMLQYIKAEID